MMTARFRSRWQKIKKHPITTVLITVAIALFALILLGGYLFHWGWTGFNGSNKSGKTLWDWMQLLFIPVVLAVAGFWFNHRERRAAELRAEVEKEIEQQRAKAEREIAQDNQRGATLQEYINKISELLLHEKLRVSQPEDEVCKIARVLTLTVLPQLDIHRKRIVIQFLHESGLIHNGRSIIDLSGADLSGAFLDSLVLKNANLSHTNLMHAHLAITHLAGANLSEANLLGANLLGANLTGANLKDATISLEHFVGMEPIITTFYHAHLTNANLSGAGLGGADLSKAKITEEQLTKAKSLKGAIMPDGSMHP